MSNNSLSKLIFFITFLFFQQYSASLNQLNSNIELFQQDLTEQIQFFIENFRVQQSTPGVAISINIPNIVNVSLSTGYSQYGFLREKITLDPKDHFRIASISKTFTSAAILKLYEENQLSLSDTITKWLPSRLEIPNQNEITIYQLLHMTTGIADFVDYLILPSAINPSQKYTPFQLIKIAAEQSPVFQPGMEFKYSNTNFVILGAIVEAVSSMSLQNYITINFINQYNLTQTIFPTTGDIPSPVCRGYIHLFLDFFIDETYFEPSQTFGCGSMISTVSDLTKWAQLLYTGQVLNSKGMSALFDNILTNSTDLGIYKQGAGVEYFKTSCDDDIIGHAGEITGYNSMLAFNEKLNISIVMFQNSFDFNQRVVPQAGEAFCLVKSLLTKYNLIY